MGMCSKCGVRQNRKSLTELCRACWSDLVGLTTKADMARDLLRRYPAWSNAKIGREAGGLTRERVRVIRSRGLGTGPPADSARA